MKIFDPQLTGSIEVKNPISGSVTTLGSVIALGSDSSLTGSFTGSFKGDGSELVGVTVDSGSWDGIFTGSAAISGSLNISGAEAIQLTVEKRIRGQYYSVYNSTASTYAGYLITSGDFEDDATTDLGLAAGTGRNIRFYTSNNSTEKMRLTTGGNLGIGIDPSTKLDIKGVAGSPATSGTTQNGIFRIQNATNNNILDIGQIAGSPNGTWLQATDSSDLSVTYPLLLNPVGGNVGIGTTNPNTALTIGAGILSIRYASGDSSGLKLFQDASDVSVIENGFSGPIKFNIAGITKLTISSAGLLTMTVGDSTNPRLSFAGTQVTGTHFIQLNRGTSAMEFYVNGATRATISSGGDVTIGTSTFGSNLGQLRVISAATSTPARLSLFGYGNVGTGANFARIDFSMQTSGTGGQPVADIKALAVGAGENASDLAFSTATGGTLAERMRISSTGKVGIGSGSNTLVYPLEVYGGNGDAIIFKDTTNSVTNWLGAFGGAAVVGALTNDDLALYAGTGEKMRISSGGNVGINVAPSSTRTLLLKGIGTTSSTAPFQVNDGNNADILVIKDDKTATFYGNIIGNSSNTMEIGNFATGNIKRIRMGQGGEIHFGDTTVASPLGITEGNWDNFVDQDRLSLYSRNDLRIFAGAGAAEKLKVTGTGIKGSTPIYSSYVASLLTPDGSGAKDTRIIEDSLGKWIQVGRFAADAASTIQTTWSSVSGLSTGELQTETTQFSSDWGTSFPTEVRIMGATVFNAWLETRTIDFIYRVPTGRTLGTFFNGGNANGNVYRTPIGNKYGWDCAGTYDGFGRWNNPNQTQVGMSDTAFTNPSSAYSTATANAFNWDTGTDAKFTVIHNAVMSGQDNNLTSGVGADDNVIGFLDAFPGTVSNMGNIRTYSSAVWVLIKLN